MHQRWDLEPSCTQSDFRLDIQISIAFTCPGLKKSYKTYLLHRSSTAEGSDLGEAFTVSQVNGSQNLYYGNVHYWAPEVREHREYSPASDIYALGCLIKTMIEKKWEIDSNNGRGHRSMPVCFLHIALRCLVTAPENRASAKSLSQLCSQYHVLYTRLIDDHNAVFEYSRDMIQANDEIWKHSGKLLVIGL
jgi:serine/threonine protein kinase